MASTSFKVIVAGGGPVGITAAHALHLAGIDFIVLERGEKVSPDVGSSLVLNPQSLRVMQQFGLLDQLLKIGAPMKHKKTFTVDGSTINDSSIFEDTKVNHGSEPIAFHRAQLVQNLYDGLPAEAKSKYLTGKKIVDVKSDDHHITVTCADGSVYDGSILIGADGVHSKTRQQIRKAVLEANPAADWDAEQPYTSEYRILWATIPLITARGEVYDTQGKDHSTMYIAGRDRAWIFLYEKLPSKIHGAAHYTEQDVQDFATRFANYPVTATHKVADVFPLHTTAGVSDLEEGVVKHWNWSRVALVGDAAHKFTPNIGLGFNNGIQDVASLCNELKIMLDTTTTAQPSITDVESAFARYDAYRHVKVMPDYSQSASATRQSVWANTFYYVLGRYVFSTSLVQNLLVNWIAPMAVRQSLVLDYVPGEERLKGRVEWVHHMKAPTAAIGK